jgi:glutamate-1-semialdehyde 2,1-aminomutase
VYDALDGDWPTLFRSSSPKRAARFKDVDGHDYVDFCLGDTGAMFGHSPAPVAAAIREQAARGFTTMLPGEDAVWVGNELKRRFGLPYWQVATTATDGNRYALRWARAVTGREKILVFDGCYHGTVEETMVRLKDGKTVPRIGQLGAITDVARTTCVVEFNDLWPSNALADRDIAAILRTRYDQHRHGAAGPGVPRPTARPTASGRDASHHRRDTHDPTGPAADARFGLEPDIFVSASQSPAASCAVFSVTADVAARMEKRNRKQHRGHGHSGMGTTLRPTFAMHAMRANLACDDRRRLRPHDPTRRTVAR